MKSEARRLFLIDGLGALVTSGLAVVIAQLEHLFGIPGPVMYLLAAIAACFAVYSLTSSGRGAGMPFLRVTSIANLLYCLLTVVVMLHFREQITSLGIAYFIAEILVVFPLALLEFSAANRSSDP